MKKYLYILLIAIVSGCSTVKVTFDYDKEADFARYKTYAFGDLVKELPVGDLNRDRVLKAIENEMQQKGFTKSDSPDIIIDAHIKTQQKVTATANTTGTGWGYRYGGGFSTTQVTYNEYTDGTLFIVFVDTKIEKIVWEGIGTKTLDENLKPDKREEAINYSIKSILDKYPPGK